MKISFMNKEQRMLPGNVSFWKMQKLPITTNDVGNECVTSFSFTIAQGYKPLH